MHLFKVNHQERLCR